jgi:prepilin-type N-terminal cleavage/methylation domain-containing protein
MNKKGFTLIELLVVIAITAILTSVMVPSLFSTKSKARDSKRISDLAQIQLALELYQDNNGGLYPAKINAGELNSYLNPLPKDPANNINYNYAGVLVGSDCSSYHLGASLENANTVLNNDRDSAVSSSLCTSSLADFNGADGAKCVGADTGSRCYDLGP